MDPEQWFLVIPEYLAVEVLVLLVCTLIWMLIPQRVGIV